MCSNCLIRHFTEAEGHHSLGVHRLGMSQNQLVRKDDQQELAQKNKIVKNAFYGRLENLASNKGKRGSNKRGKVERTVKPMWSTSGNWQRKREKKSVKKKKVMKTNTNKTHTGSLTGVDTDTAGFHCTRGSQRFSQTASYYL